MKEDFNKAAAKPFAGLYFASMFFVFGLFIVPYSFLMVIIFAVAIYFRFRTPVAIGQNFVKALAYGAGAIWGITGTFTKKKQPAQTVPNQEGYSGG